MLKNQASASPAASAAVALPGPAPLDARRIQTRRSGVHGKGVFALQPVTKGETLIEYIGDVITWPEALRRHPHDPAQPNHTFYFHLDDKHVIDGNVGGNSARWINHSCKPNCEAEDEDGRVFVKALRNIKAGEELFYDYGLIIDARHTKKLLAEFPCWCGAKKCRGTLLAPKDKASKPKSKDKPKAPGKAGKPAKGDKAADNGKTAKSVKTFKAGETAKPGKGK